MENAFDILDSRFRVEQPDGGSEGVLQRNHLRYPVLQKLPGNMAAGKYLMFTNWTMYTIVETLNELPKMAICQVVFKICLIYPMLHFLYILLSTFYC